MYFVPALVFVLLSSAFETSIEQAFTATKNKDWPAAASALDQAVGQDAGAFDANNFHYLRGRVAEMQQDWARAREEFLKIGPANPLHALATWHSLQDSIRQHDDASAEQLLANLPRDFPPELKALAAREAGGPLGLKIYQDVPTREGRFESAKLLNQVATLWNLLRESKDDDVALEAARLLLPSAVSTKDEMEVAQAFFAHRQFKQALLLYEKASADPDHAAEARFQIARVHFQLQEYAAAIDVYRAIAKDFERTDWQKQAEYQIALCYWRMDDYRSAEKAYLDYIRKYGPAGMQEGATNNLVDVYRVLGENQKALQLLDRALMTRLSPATRQVFLFTKAKILYSQKRYAAALPIFQQLAQVRLRSAPGAATTEEVQYLAALCQSKLGNKTAAESIWKKLARDELSYYGRRAMERLGRAAPETSSPVCLPARGITPEFIEADVAASRHALRTSAERRPDRAQPQLFDPLSQPVSELVFLQLWDEAAFWMERSATRIPARTAAEIAYLGGRYNRSINFADRLPRTESSLPLLYPAGYRQAICDAATTQKADPLWLQAIIWQESRYNPFARSGAAARGLMQFIPETAEAVAASLGLSNLTTEKLYDPSTSIQLGARYWSILMDQLKSPEMALAAYNGGPDNVARWEKKSLDPELFVADIGFVETKKYVLSVFAARAAYASLVK
jgi:soluble lytic murein transglycosylase-like protein/TolA-binding protein